MGGGLGSRVLLGSYSIRVLLALEWGGLGFWLLLRGSGNLVSR